MASANLSISSKSSFGSSSILPNLAPLAIKISKAAWNSLNSFSLLILIEKIN